MRYADSSLGLFGPLTLVISAVGVAPATAQSVANSDAKGWMNTSKVLVVSVGNIVGCGGSDRWRDRYSAAATKKLSATDYRDVMGFYDRSVADSVAKQRESNCTRIRSSDVDKADRDTALLERIATGTNVPCQMRPGLGCVPGTGPAASATQTTRAC